MSKSNSTLRAVTNQVTKEKLAWLDNLRKALNLIFTPLLEKFEKPENRASLKFLQEIHETLKKCSDVDNPIPNKTKDLSIFMNWIQLDDPLGTIYFGSEHLVEHWIEMLIRNIRFQIEKCEYSCLYANVMSEYMDSSLSDNDNLEDEQESTEKDKILGEFSEVIFTPAKNFDKTKLEQFLYNLFHKTEASTARLLLLHEIRRVAKFTSINFSTVVGVTTQELKFVIDGLLTEDLLGPEKGATLRELRENEDALGEVRTLLESRIKKFKDWTWPAPMEVEFRRSVGGLQKAYLDEDIVTALFLHHMGAVWSVLFKGLFKKIFSSEMWIRGTHTVGDLYYRKDSIESYRRDLLDEAFLSILPTTVKNLSVTADAQETGGRFKNKSQLTPANLKQKLIQMISNEVHLHNVLRPGKDLTVVQGNIEWLGRSLIHDVVITVMKFFGVTDEWLDFFRNFLETPVKVGSASAPVQVRKRGVPGGHLLSALFGESILFIMDLYTNQCSGLSAFRIHDDFWFWHHDSRRVTQAWEAIKTFTKLVGLSVSSEKCASVVCNNGASSNNINPGPAPLPQMKVNWGFIVLHSNGVFQIDQDLLENHVHEMRSCLDKTETVMHWINVHNKYLRLFIRNCAEPALTFGKQHVIQVLSALQKILIKVHPETNGDTVKALKIRFPTVLGDKKLMDSWFHWSIQKGGLSLYNPFLELIPLHEAYRKNDQFKADSVHTPGVFGQAIDKDREEWRKLLEESKKRRKRRAHYSENDLEEDVITDDDDEEDKQDKDKSKDGQVKKKIGCETWLERYRETRWNHWWGIYVQIFSNLPPIPSYDSGDWRKYLYSGEMQESLGGNDSFVDPNLVPLSLITAMQGKEQKKK